MDLSQIPARNTFMVRGRLARIIVALQVAHIAHLTAGLPSSHHASSGGRHLSQRDEQAEAHRAPQSELELEPNSEELELEAAGGIRPLARSHQTLGVKASGKKRKGPWSVSQHMTLQEQNQWRALFTTGQAGLNVTMWSAQGLPSGALFTPDPYCNASVVGKPESAFSTKSVDNDVNPTWDSSVIFTDFVEGDKIEFKVLDKNSLATDAFIGSAVVRSDVFFPMGYEGTVRLENTNPEVDNAYLDIKIHSVVLPNATSDDNTTNGTNTSVFLEARRIE